MIKNYLVTAFRCILRQKVYTVVNLAGLAIGLASFILIFLLIKDEVSYDRFYENVDRVYRVVFEDETYAQTRHYSVTPPALANPVEALRYE